VGELKQAKAVEPQIILSQGKVIETYQGGLHALDQKSAPAKNDESSPQSMQIS
jgi:hypothetical protein